MVMEGATRIGKGAKERPNVDHALIKQRAVFARLMMTINLTLPLADILRDVALEAHGSAENTQGAGWLVRGELDKEEYVRFLMLIWHIYHTLEQALRRHASHPTLQQIYEPSVLTRTTDIAQDVSHLLQIPESSWQSHPIHDELVSSPPPAMINYISRLQALSDSADPTRLLAHAYVRYVGDLSGSRTLRHSVAEAYGLDETGDLGLKFHSIKDPKDSEIDSTVSQAEKLKRWFEVGANVGVGDDQESKAAIAEEFTRAFELNTALFAVLRTPKLKRVSDEPAPPPLGNPMCDEDRETLSKELPIIIEQGAPEPEERMVSLSSVISVVAAVCLAHFIIVVGGLTGAKGYAKLEEVGRWLESLWESAVS